METVEMRVSGKVQGVGFRYFTMNTALDLGVKGWVKNMPDGSVLLQAAGTTEQMNLFREQVRKGTIYGRVDHLEETELPPDTLAAYTEFITTY